MTHKSPASMKQAGTKHDSMACNEPPVQSVHGVSSENFFLQIAAEGPPALAQWLRMFRGAPIRS